MSNGTIDKIVEVLNKHGIKYPKVELIAIEIEDLIRYDKL